MCVASLGVRSQIARNIHGWSGLDFCFRVLTCEELYHTASTNTLLQPLVPI